MDKKVWMEFRELNVYRHGAYKFLKAQVNVADVDDILDTTRKGFLSLQLDVQRRRDDAVQDDRPT